MAEVINFLDDPRKGHWAHIRMDNGDPCWISISQSGISVKKSKGDLFRSKLYQEKDIYRVAKTAETLGLLYGDDVAPAGIQNSVLKSFTNAVLHCRSLGEVVAVLDEVSDYLQGRTRDVFFSRKLLSLSEKVLAEQGVRASDDFEEAAVSVAVHMVIRSLPKVGQSPVKGTVDPSAAVSHAMLLCFVGASLVNRLRQEGIDLPYTALERKAGLAIFPLYEEDEALRVIAEAARRYEALMRLGEEIREIRGFSDSVHKLVYTYVVSGNERYSWILGKLYGAFLGDHASLIQEQAEHLVIDKGKRRYKRFATGERDVRAKTLFASEVDLLNVSMSGACILSKKSLKFGDKYLMRLESGGMHLTLPCVVVRESLCSSVKRGGEVIPVYRTGVAFKDMTSDRLVNLKDFIRVSGIPNEQRLSDEYRPSALRFAVCANDKAVLLFPKTSPVKKMSLGGMLLELYDGLQVEKKFPMALFLPNETLPIRFRGRVASCIAVPDERSRRFHIGVEFLDMAAYDRSRVGEFLGRMEQERESSHSPSKSQRKETSEQG